MENRHVVVTERSWFSRLGSSFGMVGFGFLMFAGGVILLGWNEKRTVDTSRGLAEGASQVVSVAEGEPLSNYEGQLIHVSGFADAEDGPLQDAQFGVQAKALRLNRQVEMFQWEEKSKTTTRTKIGGGEERVTEYTYDKTWSRTLINSSRFNRTTYQNPSSFPVEASKLNAQDVRMGELRLAANFVDQLRPFEGFALEEAADLANLPQGFRREGNGFYLGASPTQPQIGDVRVNFEVVRPGDFSVIGRLNQSTLETYVASNNHPIAMVSPGIESAELMFAGARSANTAMAWGLRAAGFALLMIGCGMIFGPLGVLADVLPFLGTLVRMGTGLLSFLIAVPTGLITIAVCWVAVRPILGISLLVVAVLVPVALLVTRKKSPTPASPVPQSTEA